MNQTATHQETEGGPFDYAHLLRASATARRVTKRKINYAPYPHQFDFHAARDKYRYRWLVTGVGAGKTTAAVMEMLILATRYKCAGLIVVPKFSVLHDVILPCLHERWPPELWRLSWIGGRPAIRVKAPHGETVIFVRSAENRRTVEDINGVTVGWAYLEEAGRMPQGELAWKYTLGRLRAQNSPRCAFIAASPRPGWLPRVFGVEEGLPVTARSTGGAETKPNYWVRRAYTMDNKSLPKDYVDSLIAAYGGAFARQEIYGDIIDTEGRIFPDYSPLLHVIPHKIALELWRKVPGNARSIGVDWGWSEPAATLIGGWYDGAMIVVDEWYHDHKGHLEQGVWTMGAIDRYKTRYLYADPEDRENMMTWKRGYEFKGVKVRPLPIQKAINDWLPGVDHLRGLMPIRGVGRVDHPGRPAGNLIGRPDLLISDRCKNLDRELRDYHEELARPNMSLRERAEGPNHAIDALRYIVHSSRRQFSYASAKR